MLGVLQTLDVPFAGALGRRGVVLLMPEQEPACRDIQRERALAAVVSLEALGQELVETFLQGLDGLLRQSRAFDTVTGCIAVLGAVDRA